MGRLFLCVEDRCRFHYKKRCDPARHIPEIKRRVDFHDIHGLDPRVLESLVEAFQKLFRAHAPWTDGRAARGVGLIEDVHVYGQVDDVDPVLQHRDSLADKFCRPALPHVLHRMDRDTLFEGIIMIGFCIAVVADADLDEVLSLDDPFLKQPSERGAVGWATVFCVPEVMVGIELDDPHRPFFFTEGFDCGCRDGMIPSEQDRERCRFLSQYMTDGCGDPFMAVRDGGRVHDDIAEIDEGGSEISPALNPVGRESIQCVPDRTRCEARP